MCHEEAYVSAVTLTAEMWTPRTAERVLWTDPVHQKRSFRFIHILGKGNLFGMNLGIPNYPVASVFKFSSCVCVNLLVNINIFKK